jgi:hypothetical protein
MKRLGFEKMELFDIGTIQEDIDNAVAKSRNKKKTLEIGLFQIKVMKFPVFYGYAARQRP